MLWLLWNLYQLGCVSRGSETLDSQSGNSPGETRCKKSWDRFEKYGSLSPRHVKQVSGKKGPSLGKIQVKNPHQRSPYARKFEDRSHAETERQQRCARSKAWNLAKHIYKLKERERERPSYILLARGRMGTLRCVNKRAREREFEVDSEAGMHLVSKRDPDFAELETVKISKSPTTVMTANGQVQSREEATVYVKELDLFVTVMLLEETPAVLSLGKLCEDHGYTYHFTSGQKPHLTQKKARKLIAKNQTMWHS